MFQEKPLYSLPNYIKSDLYLEDQSVWFIMKLPFTIVLLCALWSSTTALPKPTPKAQVTKQLVSSSALESDAASLFEEEDVAETVTAPAPSIRGGAEAGTSLGERLKVGSYFAVWYMLNIVYNSKFGVAIIGQSSKETHGSNERFSVVLASCFALSFLLDPLLIAYIVVFVCRVALLTSN